jgi:hypothetical protein
VRTTQNESNVTNASTGNAVHAIFSPPSTTLLHTTTQILQSILQETHDPHQHYSFRFVSLGLMTLQAYSMHCCATDKQVPTFFLTLRSSFLYLAVTKKSDKPTKYTRYYHLPEAATKQMFEFDIHDMSRETTSCSQERSRVRADKPETQFMFKLHFNNLAP